MPVGAKSNIMKRSPVAAARNDEISRLAGVPISVVIPPSSVANESGMSRSEGGSRNLRAADLTPGSQRASAATLFKKAGRSQPLPQRLAQGANGAFTQAA